MAETPFPVIDFSSHIADRAKDFTGRIWVLEAIHDWMSKKDASRYFLLTGDPGSGKSAVAARLCQFSLGETPPPDGFPALVLKSLSAFHFCSARSGRWIDPSIFAESLAIQLSSRYPEFAQVLAEKSGDRKIRIVVEQNAANVSGTMVGVVIKSLDVSGVSARAVHRIHPSIRTLAIAQCQRISSCFWTPIKTIPKRRVSVRMVSPAKPTHAAYCNARASLRIGPRSTLGRNPTSIGKKAKT
jgi:hypothetical protein